jgi:hypothetical protein
LLYRNLRLVIAIILIVPVLAALLQVMPMNCPTTLSAMFSADQCDQTSQIGVFFLGLASGLIAFLIGHGIEGLVHRHRNRKDSENE